MPKGHRNSVVFRRGTGPSSLQPSLLPASLDDVLEPDHLVRKLRDIAAELYAKDLNGLWKNSGGIPHDPVGMLCVWLYGYIQGTATSRRLEELCRYDSRYAHLSYGTRPDHSTLSRFRKALDSRLDQMLAGLFVVAQQRGIVGRNIVALDGTKLAGQESQWRKARLAAQDMEAKVLRSGTGGFLVGYNVQAAVYLDSGYIAAGEVVSGSNDMRAVPEVLEALRAQSEIPEQAVADAGYDTALNYQAFQQADVNPVINDSGKRVRVFTQQEDGSLVCPAGHQARKSLHVLRGQIYNRYRVSQCSNCELKKDCGVTRRQHEVQVPQGMTLKEAGLQRSEISEGDRKLLRDRGSTIELLFARMKEGRGFRRLKRRGLQAARAEIRLWILSYNLQMLLEALFRLFLALFSPKRAIPGAI